MILTVGRQLANDFPGASGNVERIARWWLALLRDHLALARGTEPFFTKGTPVGKVFRKIDDELDRPAEPVNAGAIERALQTLSEAERRLFKNAARGLPSPYRVERAKPQQEETTPSLKEEPPPGEPKPGQQPPLNRSDQRNPPIRLSLSPFPCLSG